MLPIGRKKEGQQKIVIIFLLAQIFGLILYIDYGCLRQNRCSVFNQSIVYRGTAEKSKRCFTLAWKNHTLAELLDGTAKRQGGVKGDAQTRSVSIETIAGGASLCNRFVTLEKPKGRLGNQMFEVASLIGMAYKYDVIPIIGEAVQLNEYFYLPNRVALKTHEHIVNNIKCNCKKAAVYYNCSEEFNSGANVSMRGYLQSWKYFKQARRIVQDMFRFETAHVVKARRFIESISRDGYEKVCIHIRRGDMMTKEMVRQGFATAGIAFIEKARAFYIKKFVNVQFLVVSDDKAWCRKNIKDIILSPFTHPGEEMALMMLSDHVIVTAGTFGWWGAWLSGGTTVYFNGHPRPGSMLDLETSRKDYYPSNWVGMS